MFWSGPIFSDPTRLCYVDNLAVAAGRRAGPACGLGVRVVDQAVSCIAASEVTHRARSEPPSAVLSKPLHPSIGRLLLIKPESFFYEIVDRLVQGLPIAKRDLSMDKELRRLDRFDAVIVDDIGYIQQPPEEMEVLFTFLAERYERKSVPDHIQPGLFPVGQDIQGPSDHGSRHRPNGASLHNSRAHRSKLSNRSSHRKHEREKGAKRSNSRVSMGNTLAPTSMIRYAQIYDCRQCTKVVDVGQ